MSQGELTFRHRHLLGIADLDARDIVQILDLADSFMTINERDIKKVPTLRGRSRDGNGGGE